MRAPTCSVRPSGEAPVISHASILAGSKNAHTRSDADIVSWCSNFLGLQVRAKLRSSAYWETMTNESSPVPSILTVSTFAPLLTSISAISSLPDSTATSRGVSSRLFVVLNTGVCAHEYLNHLKVPRPTYPTTMVH
jgi:hypothetical protein